MKKKIAHFNRYVLIGQGYKVSYLTIGYEIRKLTSFSEDLAMDCIFCKVIRGEIPAKVVYRDDSVIAIEDINPQAPHHLLIMPQKHIPTLNDLKEEDNELMGHMVQTAKKLAKELAIAEEGYRLAMNCNEGAGQTVFHIHLHLMGGRPFRWPPG